MTQATTLDGLKHNTCCMIMGACTMLAIAACAIDTDQLEAKRARLDKLCSTPSTIVVREFCDQVGWQPQPPTSILDPQ